MKTTSLSLALLIALIGLAPVWGQKQEPKPTVEFASSWNAAVAEAKALGVPIVVHSHGFY
jgi:hypothetical protein